MVNKSCVTLGSALVMLRLSTADLILLKFVEVFTVQLLDAEANSLAVSTVISLRWTTGNMFSLPEDSFVSSVGLMWGRYLAKDEHKYHRHH